MSLPSITIITPCLNAASTIGAALDSVQAQNYPHLEHIVMDGGSTDATGEIVRERGLRFESEPDDGRPDAINKGLALAQGDIVGFLNADDVYEPEALLRVGRAFAARPDTEWVTGYCRIVDSEGHEIRKPVTAYKNALLRRFSHRLYLTHNFVSDPATFARRSALLEVGPLEARWRISHDYDVWLRFAERGDPVVIPEVLSAFMMADGTASMEGFERQFSEHEEIARQHATGHPVALQANRLLSRLIVLAYRAMRALRRRRAVS